MATVSSIFPLPADVLSQIRSSVTIASLNDVVLDLVKNSLDSNASNIEVAVDYSRGSCTVEDNGLGIEPVEFSERGGLGKLHHTSKSFQCADNHGGCGSFIALLSALSLVAITSHHQQHRSHNTLTMHQSKVIARQTPTPAEHRISGKDHGTRVTVRDLFGSMPVRVRQRASESVASDREWQGLKKSIVGLLLAWPYGVSITVRNTISGQNLKIRSSPGTERRELDVNYLCNILSQAMFITPSDKDFWISATGSTSNLAISGIMSTEPCPHKNVQFLSLHVHPIADINGSNLLYDHINRLFAMSSFGNEEEDESLNGPGSQKKKKDGRYKKDGYTTGQLKSSKKGSNRWPMFYLKIESRDVVSAVGEDMTDEFLDEKRGHLTSVMDLLKAIVVGFLKEHHFRVGPGNRSGKHGRSRDRDSQSMRHLQAVNQRKMAPRSKISRSSEKHARMNLGTEIKLPSFSRGLLDSFESPFDTWTRVKRGQKGAMHTEVDVATASFTGGTSLEKGDSSAENLEITARRFFGPGNETLGSHFGDHKSKTTGYTRKQSADTPLIELDGKVSRLPFKLERRSPREKNGCIQPQDIIEEPSIPSDYVENSDDNFIAWIDPVSKDRSLICRRTGLVVTPKSMSDLGLSLTTSKSHTLAPRIRPVLRNANKAREEPSTWISGLLNSWDNPVFQPAELPIPKVSIDSLNIESQQAPHSRHHMCKHSDVDKAFQLSSGGPTGRLTKDALRNAEVISQVDKKFILIKTSTAKKKGIGEGGPTLLVLVDQHAADERCRVEELFHELCTNTVPQGLEIPMSFDISEMELQLFRRNTVYFQNWGISYEVPDFPEKTSLSRQVKVKGLPSVIIERCKLEPNVLVKLMRAEVWKSSNRGDSRQLTRGALDVSETKREWFEKLRECPEGLLDILNSRSCRSAIMFNDELSTEQCKSLISRLARCAFPFQCAHGRPSMIPLVDLSTILQNH